jgi:Flp pilus assembly protein TadB
LRRGPVSESKDGNLYRVLAKFAARAFGPSGSALERRRSVQEARLIEVRKEVRRNRDELERLEFLHGAGSAQSAKARKTLSASEKKSEAAKESLMQERFRRAVGVLGLDVEAHEVSALSSLSFLAFFGGGLAVSLSFAIALGFALPDVAVYLLCVALMSGVVGYYIAASYPFMMAKRARMRSLGKSPEAICYMVMSLNLVPSLERAVAFAAENSEEPLATALRKVMWDVYMREGNTVDDSFAAFASEWTGESEELKMSLYSIRGAVAERSPEGRARVLEKATDVALTGTRRRIEEFAASLSGPSTILFALGILLPLVVGSMLPLMAIGTLDLSGLTGGATAEQDPRTSLAATVILMDFVFPAAAFAYAFTVLGRRPGTSSATCYKGDGRKVPLAPIVICALMLCAGVLLALQSSELWTLLGVLFAIGGVAVSAGLYLYITTAERKRERDSILKMEGEFPDALFQLGRRVAEGIPLEAAFGKVGGSMAGSDVGRLFLRISNGIRMTGMPIEKALFDPEFGALAGVRSRTIRATLKAVVSSAELDPSAAGKMMMDFSGYLRDLRKADQDIRLQLSGVSENMRSTATFFAPLIMGVTVGLYSLMSNTFAEIGGSNGMPVWLFAAIICIYLSLMVCAISYFCSRLLYGDDDVEMMSRLGKSLITSWVVFFFAVSVAYSGFA